MCALTVDTGSIVTGITNKEKLWNIRVMHGCQKC